ncbi:MAG: hypothetical protein E7G33_19400 [Bacteroides sp.]|nr:hypothetical protein [Bacteroides sp.]
MMNVIFSCSKFGVWKTFAHRWSRNNSGSHTYYYVNVIIQINADNFLSQAKSLGLYGRGYAEGIGTYH